MTFVDPHQEDAVMHDVRTDNHEPDGSPANEDPAVQSARARLKEVSSSVNKLTLRLERARHRFGRVCASVAAHKWTTLALHRAPADYNRLSSTTLRESCGAITEELMRVLLDLDTIESHGDADVRDRRRALVRRINGKLLPRADALLTRARRLEDTDRHAQQMLQALEQPQSQQSADEGADSSSSSSSSDEEHGEKRSTEASQENAQMAEPAEPIAEPSPATPPAPQQPKRARRAVNPLRYKLQESSSEATILCELPEGARVDDAEVSVDRQRGELQIRVGPAPPLVFDVRDPHLAPLSATFKEHAPGVLRVTIPKVARRRPPGARPRRAFAPQQHTPIWGL